MTQFAPLDRTATGTTLQWAPLMAQPNDMFIYEVVHSARPNDTQCTDSIDTLPIGYTLFGSTTGTSIEVSSIQPVTWVQHECT